MGEKRLSDYLKPGRTAWSDAYHDNGVGDPYACIVCGKRASDNAIWVILGGGGDTLILPENDEEAMETDSGYMGWHVLGPECGRDVPQRYRANPNIITGGQP